jgi:Tautomerase enzyme
MNHWSNTMPLIDIQLIEGVFSPAQKKEMIEKVTDTMVQIEGEASPGSTFRKSRAANGPLAASRSPPRT